MTEIDDVETELRRVVDRLTSMPLAKAEQSLDMTHHAAALILEQTRLIDPMIPAGATVPRVSVSAAGAQLAVLGNDYLEAVRGMPNAQVTPVLDELVSLRRSLP